MKRFAIHELPKNRRNKYAAGRKLGLVVASTKRAAAHKYFKQHPGMRPRTLRVFNTRTRR